MPQQWLCICRQEVADRLSALAQADSVRTRELSARQDNLERSLREVGDGCQAFALYCMLVFHLTGVQELSPGLSAAASGRSGISLPFTACVLLRSA